MKLVIVLITASFLHASAAGYAQTVTINVRKASIETVLNEIRQQTGYDFLYNSSHLSNTQPVDLQFKNTPIAQVLDACFANQPLTYQIVDNTVLLHRRANSAARTAPPAQQRQIRGSVTNEQGEALQGVSVSVKETAGGTVTNNDGDYQLTLSAAAQTLVFSIVGYERQELSIPTAGVLNVTMRAQVSDLDEVVVVGYGVQSRRDVIGAVGVASSEDFGDVAVSNTSQLIQGKIAGVQVINNSGAPGSGTQIVIRGTGSFTNAAPLYVIDGIQSDQGTFNSLSPYDIQDITVLKDASSVAIYGAQGANGVVIVTTRRPKTGVPRITYNGYVGISNPWKQFDMLNAEQYTGVVKEWYANQGQVLPSRVGSDEALVTRTDWQDEMFKTGTVHEHYLSVGGGTDNITYNVSAGYTKQDGQIVERDFQRANVRINLQENVGQRIRLGQALSIRHQLIDGVSANVVNGLRMPPYIPVYDPSNELGGFGIATSLLDGNDSQNPLIQPYLRDVKDRGLNNYLQLFGEIDLIDGLKFRSQIGGVYNFSQYYNYNPTYAANQLVTQNQISEDYGYNLSYIWENYFTYDKRFKDHSLTVTAGNSYRDGGVSRTVDLVGSNFPNDEIHQIGAAKTISFGSGSANSEARFISYFGRINYAFKDRYIITLTGRRDATSLFSEANRVGYFPSIGLGWRLSDEPFMADIAWISDLKLRGSWGKTGNSNIRGFSFQSNVWTGGANSVVYPLGPNETLHNGATIAIPATPSLQWESTTTLDAGIDAMLFDNRLSVSIGYYDRDNDDLLVEVPLALSTGYGGVSGASSSQLINAASAYNRGFELGLGYQGATADWKYSVNVNGSYNKNEVTSLGTQGAVPIIDGSFYSVPSMTRTDVGLPIGSYYGFIYDHVAIDAADVDHYNALARQVTGDPNAVYQSGLLPGDRIFKDLNGDGVVTEVDKTYLGSPIPKWNYGLNINLSYKQFDFMAALQGVADVQLINGTKYYLEGVALPFNAKTAVLSSWTQEGDVTDIARIGQNPGTSANLRPSSWFVEDAGFARIRNITLGYTFSSDGLKQWTDNTVTNLRIYVTAQNLFTFTNYSGYDPEVTGSGNFIFSRGIDTGQIPQPRTFMFGVQLGF